MNISQTKVKELLAEWQKLTSKERDKIIFDALFESFVNESIPMFSDNNKDNAAMDSLITKLRDLGVSDIVIEELPRSTRSRVTVDGVELPIMPAHKAIAFAGYIMAHRKEEV